VNGGTEQFLRVWAKLRADRYDLTVEALRFSEVRHQITKARTVSRLQGQDIVMLFSLENLLNLFQPELYLVQVDFAREAEIRGEKFSNTLLLSRFLGKQLDGENS